MDKISVRTHEELPSTELLEEEKNILDQEPYRSILLQGLVSGSRYWKGVDTSSPDSICAVEQEKTFEAHQRQMDKINAQAMLVSMAVKHPDICAQLFHIPKGERAQLFVGQLFNQSKKFKTNVFPLVSSLKPLQRIELTSVLGAHAGLELLGGIMTEASDHRGWDEYLREYRTAILSDGERRNIKKPHPIVFFWKWIENHKPE